MWFMETAHPGNPQCICESLVNLTLQENNDATEALNKMKPSTVSDGIKVT